MNRLVLISLATFTSIAIAACNAQSPGIQADRGAADVNQTTLSRSQPIPTLVHSEERQNLIQRADRLNQQNMTGCVSVFTPSGILLYQGVVDGKVSSLNSYLLPGDRRDNGSNGAGDPVVIESPDIDGAYGENSDGVFFFNADSNAYIEAGNVTYIFTDQCLATTAKPLLVQSVTSAAQP